MRASATTCQGQEAPEKTLSGVLGQPLKAIDVYLACKLPAQFLNNPAWNLYSTSLV